jgi:hypothetical protein
LLKLPTAHERLSGHALEYAIGSVQANQEGLKLYDAQRCLVYTDDVNIQDEIIQTVEKNAQALKLLVRRFTETLMLRRLNTCLCLVDRTWDIVTA